MGGETERALNHSLVRRTTDPPRRPAPHFYDSIFLPRFRAGFRAPELERFTALPIRAAVISVYQRSSAVYPLDFCFLLSQFLIFLPLLPLVPLVAYHSRHVSC